MKTKLLLFLCLIFTFSMILSSCMETANDNYTDDEKQTASDTGDDIYLSHNYVVDNISALRELKITSDEITVTVKGYYAPGDGGGGIFYWDSSSAKQDDGGIYIKTAEEREKGRFVRLCEDNYRNVKWFGAKGDGKSDDYTAIASAIACLGTHGGTVELPGGNYLISKSILIGNGNAGDTWSSYHGIKLVGSGGGFGVHSEAVPTYITASANMDAVIKVNGLISGVVIKDMYINGNLKAKTGVYLNAICGLTMSNVRVHQFTEKGIAVVAGEAPTGNYNIFNRFETVSVTTTADNSICLFMDGCYEVSNDTWLTTFTNCSFDTGESKGSSGAYFKFVDSISFYTCNFKAKNAESTGIVFDALDNHDFPSGIGFYNCSVSSTKVIEDTAHSIRINYFYGFSTSDGEIIPEHHRLVGITDTGVPFNMDALGDIGSGGDGSNLPIKKGVVDLYSNAEFMHYNLHATRSTVGVLVNCGGTLTSGKAYMPNYDNEIGTIHIKVYKWNTDYDTTVKGEVLSSYSFVNFQQNTWLPFELSEALPADTYLIVFSAEAPAGDYGCGIWAQKNAHGIKTFYDGVEVDFGVVCQITVR